jgi:hypothetical protein
MRATVFLLSAVLLSACHDDEVCNPGLELKDGVCVPSPKAADPTMTADGGAGHGAAGATGTAGAGGSGGSHDAAATDAADASSDASSDATTDATSDVATIDAATDAPATNFGKTCMTSAACAQGGPATFCAIQPPATMGFCSKTGCDTAPSICPTGWSCYVIPGVIAVCSPPQ